MLAETVGARDQQQRRHPLREVERDREVDQDLAGQVLGADQLEGVQ
jgi:hypothetical protein